MAAQDRYALLEKIGTGSFATVYRAKDRELGREVAIKQLHQEFLDDPARLDRYWQEAQLVASLHHPHIVTIFDIDRERGWLVMELMQGNLAERLADRQMDLTSLRTTIGNCLRVLKYLHERGIVHGDIKPSNMMIDERRRIKIGLSVVREHIQRFTPANSLLDMCCGTGAAIQVLEGLYDHAGFLLWLTN